MEFVISITVRTNVEILSLGKISLHQCNVMRHIFDQAFLISVKGPLKTWGHDGSN